MSVLCIVRVWGNTLILHINLFPIGNEDWSALSLVESHGCAGLYHSQRYLPKAIVAIVLDCKEYDNKVLLTCSQ